MNMRWNVKQISSDEQVWHRNVCSCMTLGTMRLEGEGKREEERREESDQVDLIVVRLTGPLTEEAAESIGM